MSPSAISSQKMNFLCFLCSGVSAVLGLLERESCKGEMAGHSNRLPRSHIHHPGSSSSSEFSSKGEK